MEKRRLEEEHRKIEEEQRKEEEKKRFRFSTYEGVVIIAHCSLVSKSSSYPLNKFIFIKFWF